MSAPPVMRSPFLFDAQIEGVCTSHRCTRLASRAVVQVVEEGAGLEVAMAFLCDGCADAAHVAMQPVRGVA